MNIIKELDNKLTEIAAKHLHIKTLKTQNMDSLDFHEVAVWDIRRALMAAFNAGANRAMQEAEEQRILQERFRESTEASQQFNRTTE